MSKDTFKDNPELKEVFTTADGSDFYTRNAAENHARTLKDRTITRKKNPSNTEAAEVDMDDPQNASLGLIQTGVDEKGNPELKQIVAQVDDNGSVDLAVANVNDAPAVDKTTVETIPAPTDDAVTKITETPVIQELKKVVEATTAVKVPSAKKPATKATTKEVKNTK